MMTYFRDHWTLSEWLSVSTRRDELVAEDADKRHRLAILRTVAGIPSAETTTFSMREVVDETDAVARFVIDAGAQVFALRLTPTTAVGDVRRQRGQPVPDLIEWAKQLDLDEMNYEAQFEPHIPSVASTILVCNRTGVWGDFLQGPLLELNRGSASRDLLPFKENWEEFDGASLPGLVLRALEFLAIESEPSRRILEAELSATFTEDHLHGYFEVIQDPNGGVWFVDFNRLLVDEAPIHVLDSSLRRSRAGSALRGVTGSPGFGRGRVAHAGSSRTTSGEPYVLVARATSPDLIPIMADSQAVVTEVGGVLSHAAIACRELRIPCLVGLSDALTLLPEGAMVEVSASEGKVTIL